VRIESLKRVFIPFLFALALSMAFAPAPVYPQTGGWQVEVIVDNTVYHHHPPPSERAQVVQGGTFIIRHTSSWIEPEYSGSYSISIYWDCYENHPYENFTFLYTQAYFISGENAGEAIENTVIFQALPVGAHTRYAVSVSNIADDRDGQFNVDVVMRASGAGGVPHIPTPDNAPAIITYGNLEVAESTIVNEDVDPIEIKVLPLPPWTGTAVFSLENLYAVCLEKNLDLNEGSKLVVKFYTWWDGYENESVIENFVPPWHVEEIEKVPNPTLPWCHKSAVKKARLDMTTDNTENVISTIASFTVTRDPLIGRVRAIKGFWPWASPDERDKLWKELRDIRGLWAYAPS